MLKKISNYFYTTWVGNLYFEFLLWLDRRSDKSKLKYMSPKEISQLVKEYSLVGEGVSQIKKKINSIVLLKTPEEYDKVLKEVSDLAPLADRGPNSAQAQLAEVLKKAYVYTEGRDITSSTDRARMVKKRIENIREWQEYSKGRKLIKEIRKARNQNNLDLANKLEEEWKNNYGKRNN